MKGSDVLARTGTLMGWRYDSCDNRIEVIVEPDFQGDLIALASSRPVWIVDTPQNGPRIAAVWASGADLNLCEVSKYGYKDRVAGNRVEDLLEIIGCLDDHHPHHDIVVHGIGPSDLIAVLLEEGYRVQETTLDGFVAVQIPEVRDRLIGRL
jgi:hypothetical protein